MDPQFDIEAAEEFEVAIAAETYGSEDEDTSTNDQTLYESNEASVEIKTPIRNFLENFRIAIRDKNTVAINSFYESGWNNFTAKFFKSVRWPSPDVVLSHFKNDTYFIILYKELYYRHAYSRGNLTLQDRYESFKNYCDLFNAILNTNNPVGFDLPNQWLWDIIDEFIYQFQSYCQYRNKLKGKSDSDSHLLKEKIWDIHSVLNVLHSLIEKSKIQEQLLMLKQGKDTSEIYGDYGGKSMYRMLGYFAIIGLLRLHCQLGDYHLALKMMENIELNKKGLFTRVTACHITTYFYVGFCYVMTRRYQDAARTFAQILYFISKTKLYQVKSLQNDMIQKQNEQMYTLLAICVTLFPQKVDESVEKTLLEKNGEKMQEVLKGNDPIKQLEEWFVHSCPKFITPNLPDLENPAYLEPMKYQMSLFIRDAKQQLFIPIVRSYMKLYTTMSVSKLASFMQMDEDTFRMLLIRYKHKTRQKKWQTGSVLQGEYTSQSDFNFYLREDMIHIVETKMARRYGEYFIRQINKFSDGIEDLQYSVQSVKAN